MEKSWGHDNVQGGKVERGLSMGGPGEDVVVLHGLHQQQILDGLKVRGGDLGDQLLVDEGADVKVSGPQRALGDLPHGGLPPLHYLGHHSDWLPDLSRVSVSVSVRDRWGE